MLLLLLFLEFSFFVLSNVAALNITVQSNTIVGQPSLVIWARDPSDGNGQLLFDLRFVKPDNEDVGLALANIQAPPSVDFGTVQVVFPSPGPYLLVAVSGPEATQLGRSGQVNAFQVSTTSMSTSTSQPSPAATTRPTSTTASTRNLGAIIGGTLGGVAFLGLLATLLIVFLRRRQPTVKRRWTFYRDKMVLPPVLDIRPISPMNAQFLSPGDIERGLPHGDIPTSPIVMIASPSGPRPLLKLPNRPLPLPPVPLKPHQEDLVEQMEQIRAQITELKKSPGPAQHIIMDDLQKQMVWLQSQYENLRS